MPVVPQYNFGQVGTEVVRQPMLTPEAFGAGLGREMQGLGKTVQAVSQEWDKTKAREILNQAIPEIDEAYKSFKMQNQGSLATPEKYDAFTQDLRKKQDALTKGLSPYAKDLVFGELSAKQMSYSTDWNSHYIGEQEKARVSSLNAENERFANMIAQGVDVDELGDSYSTLIEQNLKSANAGMTDDVIKGKALEVEGKARMARVVGLMETNPEQALEVFGQHRDLLSTVDPVATEKLGQDINKRYREQKIIAGVREATAKNVPLSKALEMFPTDQWPDVKRQYDAFNNAKEAEANKMVGNTYSDQAKFISSIASNPEALALYTAPVDLPDGARNALNAFRDTLVAEQAGKAVETDWSAYGTLIEMAEVDSTGFLDFDLNQVRLAPAELKKLIDLRAAKLKDGKGEAPDGYAMTAVGRSVDAVFGDKKSMKVEAKQWVSMEINRWAQDYKKEFGKDPTRVDIDAQASLLSTYYKNNDKKVGVLGLAKPTGMYSKIGDIAEADRRLIADNLASLGINVEGKAGREGMVKVANAIASGKLNMQFGRIPDSEMDLGLIELVEAGITPTRENLFRWYIQSVIDETPLIPVKK